MRRRTRVWLCLLAAVVLALLPVHRALAHPPGVSAGDQTILEYPTAMPPIAVSVVQDSLDPRGHWVQTVRLTILPGGTLSDASEVVFGDVSHVDTIFGAARRINPTLTNPAMIPIGQQIDVRIDPSTVFVLDAVLHGSNTLVQRFTNGVVSTVYQTPHGSVERRLMFPDGKPTDFFSYPSSNGPINVRPGGRIVDLRYARGETFAQVVKQTYGVTTFAAAADLTRQTGWDPTRWPPPIGELKRVVTGPPGLYETVPAEITPIPNPDPIGRLRQVKLHRARLKVGVYAVRTESFGTVYHVAVNDPSVRASELSKLIYGSASHRLEIARAAGYQLPVGAHAQLARFDPRLFGRAFDLDVPFQDEDVVVRRRIDARGVETVDLVDGATITTFPRRTHGVVRLTTYPTGYKRIVYRPSRLSLTVARGLALFHIANNLDLPSDTANQLARDDAARLLWQWSPGMPREAGDIADSVRLVDGPGGTLLEVLVGPPVPRTLLGDVAAALQLENPLVAATAVLFISVVVFMAVELARQYPRRRRRVRW